MCVCVCVCVCVCARTHAHVPRKPALCCRTSVCALPISPAASQAAAVGEKETGAPPSSAVK